MSASRKFETKRVVEDVLRSKPETRDDDSKLYYEVCKIYNPDVVDFTFRFMFNNLKMLSVPNYETVRRSRQKLMQDIPELRASADVEAARELQEEEYIALARS